MAKYTVTNTASGPRGLNIGDNGAGYLELAPGQTVENVVLNDAEHASAVEAGYFTFGSKVADPAKAPAASAKGDSGGDGLPNNMPKLKGIAKTEGVDLTGKTTVADIQTAILDARKAKADQAAGEPADELDKLDDNTLLATVAAITGKSVAELEGNDRAALLALARKQD